MRGRFAQYASFDIAPADATMLRILDGAFNQREPAFLGR